MSTDLVWPVTSKAFSSINVRRNDDIPGSPPRKAPRLSNTSSRAGSGADYKLTKKLTISNIHEEPRLDPRENKKTIETMLGALLNRTGSQAQDRALPSSYKRLFEAVEAAVLLLGTGADIYSMLTTKLQRTCAEVIAKRLTSEKGLPWLSLLIDEWKWFEFRLNLLECLFTWLDRAYTCPKGISSIHQLGLQIFQNYVIYHNTIHDEITPCIEEWVNSERNTHAPAPYRDQITALIRMFQQLGLYESEFEVPYVLISQRFYKGESDVLASNGISPTEFINHCLRRVEEEVQRCRDLLPKKTLTTVEKCVEKALLEKRVPWIVGGILPLLREKDIGGIRNMYDLLARVEAFEPIRLAFAQSTEIIIAEIVMLPVSEEEEMVPRLLQFREFIDALIASAFREGGENKALSGASDEKVEKIKPSKTRGPFAYAASDAFARGFSKRPRKPAEMIAKYIDRLMRHGQKGSSDRDFDEKLDSVLALYQYTTDRDVFRTFYWRGLAKRLLLARSASDDFEKTVIKKLREGYDPEFGKGNQMFKDLELSRDLLEEFHTKYPDFKFMSAMVLQSSSWPYQPKQGREIDLPPQLLSNLEQFEKFYRTKHERHKIDWYHSLGTVTLAARFPAGQKELSVSLYQATVLMLFNEKDKFEYAEIKELTNLEDAELRRTLQSLACGKKRVLTKVPAGKDVNERDEFLYNAKFTDPHHNIRINSIQEKVTVEESQATDKRIQEDRSYLLDAAIVRIMKGRKKLSHQRLIQETVDTIKKHFQPDVGQIKKQIESLTDREYIRRDNIQREIYHYVA